VTEDAESAFPIDPGTHRVVAREGERTWPERVVDAAPGSEHVVRFDALELAPPAQPIVEPEPPAEESSSAGWWILAGAGVAVAAAVAVTLVFVLAADEPVVGRGVTLSL
jgi:hypothetical protein